MLIEKEIILNLIYFEEYSRSVLPYLKREHFLNVEYGDILEEIIEYTRKYNKIPTIDAILIDIERRKDISDAKFKEIKTLISNIENTYKEVSRPDKQWLVDKTEEYVKGRAINIALYKAVDIVDGTNKKSNVNSIPELLCDALSVSFDESIGHDYLEDIENRWKYYNKQESRFKFNVEWLNRITDGGIPRKTLNCFLAATGVGKTMVMCHLATDFMLNGKNVLYITMEMSEEEISKRIDANILDVPMNSLKKLNASTYLERIGKVKQNTVGKLYVKEFPTASAHVGHFRHLVRELKLKRKFIPDIIFIDYLGICASVRVKGAENTYVLIKSVAEEIRGFAIETNTAIFTATQTNRAGYNNDDVDMSNTSESAGLNSTVDLMVALIATEKLKQSSHIKMKQLKSRYDTVTSNVTQIFNCDPSKSKISPVETEISNPVSGVDNTTNQKSMKNKFNNFRYN